MGGITDFFAGLASGGASGIAQITEKATKGVTDIIAASKGELTPEAQAALETLKVTLSKDISNAMAAQTKAAQDFALAYEGGAAQVPGWILAMRSVIRPMFTLFFFLVLMVATSVDFVRVLQTGVASWQLLTSLPDPFWWIFGIVIAFWFGDRAASSIIESWKTGKKETKTS